MTADGGRPDSQHQPPSPRRSTTSARALAVTAAHPTEPMLPAVSAAAPTATLPDLATAAGGSDRPFLLLTTTPAEQDAMRAAIRRSGTLFATPRYPGGDDGPPVEDASWHGQRIWLSTVGPGHPASVATANRLASVSLAGVAILGTGSAIDEALQPGQLVIATACASPIRPHGPAKSTPAVRRLAESARKAIRNQHGIESNVGGLVTIDEPADTPAKKAKLQRQWRSSGYLAVDQVTTPIAYEAHRNGLPWLAACAIFDAAAESIPPPLLAVANQTGFRRAIGIAGLLVRRPWLLPPLPRLARRATDCATALARYAEAFAMALALPDIVDTDHLTDPEPSEEPAE